MIEPPTIASVPKRAATSVWISVDMKAIGGATTYSVPAAVPPERS